MEKGGIVTERWRRCWRMCIGFEMKKDKGSRWTRTEGGARNK